MTPRRLTAVVACKESAPRGSLGAYPSSSMAFSQPPVLVLLCVPDLVAGFGHL